MSSALHQALYHEVIKRSLPSLLLKKTDERWRRTEMWHRALCEKKQMPGPLPPDKMELAGALWLHRLDYPAEADNVLILAGLLLQGQKDVIFPQGVKTSPPKIILQARLNRLENRWRRLREVLRSEQIPSSDRAAVSGRFYQLLSEQIYELERHKVALQVQTVRGGFWGKIAGLEDGARPLQREALGFLGGLLVRHAELDREPAGIIMTEEDGPGICDLADVMLQEFARRAGVNWSARTVVGKDPFLAEDTEVIRVRFPDWSIWNLPLMAHEFGHLVALDTRAFLEYQEQEASVDPASPSRPTSVDQNRYRQTLRRHLDELFADLFATYALGPAFACNVFLLHLNPAEAYLSLGTHPAHDVRAQVILQTLGRMNESARQEEGGDEPYARLQADLSHGWSEAKRTSRSVQKNETLYNLQLKQALRWGEYLYRRVIDRFYRLGAHYTPSQFAFAKKVAEPLRIRPVEIEKMMKMAEEFSLDEVRLRDVLNALWWARLMSKLESMAHLNFAANRMGCDYLLYMRSKV